MHILYSLLPTIKKLNFLKEQEVFLMQLFIILFNTYYQIFLLIYQFKHSI